MEIDEQLRKQLNAAKRRDQVDEACVKVTGKPMEIIKRDVNPEIVTAVAYFKRRIIDKNNGMLSGSEE